MFLNIFRNFDQVIIYGAKGWIGSSAAGIAFESVREPSNNQILLVGSNNELAHVAGTQRSINSAEDALGKISENSLFLNAAYLRREKLQEMSKEEYLDKNKLVGEFPKQVIKSGKCKTIINFSSGVAANYLSGDPRTTNDLYAKLKATDESVLKELCNQNRANIVNCRIYSLTGRNINEFNNLAFSLFIKQAQTGAKKINVQSPKTLRTFIDSVDLVRVLFNLTLRNENYEIDSGGELITLGNLALKISKFFPGSEVVEQEVGEKSPDYLGDFLNFNKIASDLKIDIKNINEQISESLPAFKSIGIH